MQRFISWWGHHCIIIESKSVCSMHYISLQYFLLCTFAIPSSISLIFRKSTQFAASQLFLLNMVFDFNLWSIFQISRKFFSLTKLSTFFSYFPYFGYEFRSRIDRWGEVDVMPSSRDADLSELSPASKNFIQLFQPRAFWYFLAK